jgi:molybdate transport system substrate-binding protein
MLAALGVALALAATAAAGPVPLRVYAATSLASANTSDPAALHAKGLVSRPVVFAHNTIVVIVRAKNAAHIRTLADLKRHGVRVEIADQTLALGGYTLQILKTLHLNAVLANVVGRDDDVRKVVAKVESGTVDAGFVYASDAHAAGSRVNVVAIPARAQPNVAYAAAVVLSSSRQADAQAFVARLRLPAAQAALRASGFR